MTITSRGDRIKMLKKIVDKIVYKTTKKPSHYVEVKNPPKTLIEKLARPQDARQVQYNNWSKAHRVYSGSYLPDNGEKLLKKGWADESKTASSALTQGRNDNQPSFYRRKSTNQWVRHDKNDQHWHWYNWWRKDGLNKYFRKNKNAEPYLDKYGEPCKVKSKQSHLEEQE